MLTWLVAIAMGVAIFAAALWGIRLLATPQPAEPDPDEVREIAADFRCIVCGLRLTVTHAHDETPEAPRHCREDMIPV